MKATKLFSIVVIGIVGLYGAAGLYFLPMADFEGDLTRMGKVPESMFGWNKPRPLLERELFRPVSWQEADVLVVGDSFSDGRVWQTVLARQGLRTRTEHWASVRGICENFHDWVRAQGFKGKWIVFEAVERNIEEGLPNAASCKETVYHPSVLANAWRGPLAVERPQAGGWSGRISVGIDTAWNAFELRRKSSVPGFESASLDNGVVVRRMPHGCELFSHERCEDTLFLGSDSAKDLSPTLLDFAVTINSRLQDITPVWVFVPNKSTAYLYPDKQFWNEAERRLNSPNLLRAIRQALEAKTVDLYPANNTHFSTMGYLLMGEEILKTMRQAGLRLPRETAAEAVETGA